MKKIVPLLGALSSLLVCAGEHKESPKILQPVPQYPYQTLKNQMHIPKRPKKPSPLSQGIFQSTVDEFHSEPLPRD